MNSLQENFKTRQKTIQNVLLSVHINSKNVKLPGTGAKSNKIDINREDGNNAQESNNRSSTIRKTNRKNSVAESQENKNDENPLLIEIPNPSIVVDNNGQEISIRCVCKEKYVDCLLVKCTKCGNYVHGKCVGIARILPKSKYICPYCAGHALRCNCENNEKYDEPIIKCTKCRYWVHKSCAGFTFGINPKNFLCYNCGNPTYHLPKPFFSDKSMCKDINVNADFDRTEFINKIPNGEFRDMIEEDLKKSEFSFRDTLIRYADEYIPCLFDYSHEFWKVFTSTFSEMFKCEKIDIMEAVDELVVNILYQPFHRKLKKSIPGFAIADSIKSNIETAPIPKLETFPDPVKIYLTKDLTVCIGASIENNAFICEIPGLLCHEDEVDATEGIPRTVINVPNTQIIIDISRSTNTILHHIRRSFNFNCVVKLFKVKGKVHAGLYGIRTKGPLSEEKMSKTAAIEKDSELFLPLDADIPYSVIKPIWREKKTRNRNASKSKKQKADHNKAKSNNSDSNNNPHGPRSKEEKTEKKKKPVHFETRSMKTRARSEFPVSLTLLSAFVEDACPPLPIIIKDQREIDMANPPESSIRSRLRNPAYKHLPLEQSQ